ncbi:MAG: excinuclease ABC subunit UvrC [Lachnospiraceae bacterium]|nr:excinuclease ABC subunit UvrC [Lachnospiraceae bacterium]
MFVIEDELKKLPARPGVYIMHDASDQIIYVGKAISLKNRVRQYFQSSRNHTEKIRQMVAHIDHFEYIVTDSEVEALVLECNLIKEHRPKYNTMLKDDKGYPYIRVTNEAFPRIQLMRKKNEKDKSKYYGPFTSAGAVRDSLDLLHKIYKIRTCNRSLPRDIGKERPCLNYHIGQCSAPCQGYISEEDYQAQVAQAVDFLEGNYDPVIKLVEARMLAASDAMEFERAAEQRDLMNSVKQLAEKQKITDANLSDDRDVIAFAREENDAVVQVFFIRSGRMIGREHFYVTNVREETDEAVLTDFVKQFYAGTPIIPREILLQNEIDDREAIEEFLRVRRGQKVQLLVPKLGEKRRLVMLAKENADMVLKKDMENIRRETLRTVGAVHEIEEWLGLTGLSRMESYDISNISGYDSVGSMVVFENGKAKHADYRKFRIRTVVGPDDYASMREVLTRRFSHGLKEQEEQQAKHGSQAYGKFNRFPDLILMDGGRGQVNIALEVLESLDLKIPVCGMVKDDNHRTRGLYYNNVEIPIDTHSEGFQLITRIQDETHRFVIEYHRSLRGKGQTHSILDEIPGVGETRRKALMRHYKSLEEIRAASVEELSKIETMNKRSALQVYDFFHKEVND